jgi:Flp pilus assembly protein TadB
MIIGWRIFTGMTFAIGILFVLAGARGLRIIGSLPIRTSVDTRDEREIVEALAVWTEQLRDTIAGASGIEQAITVTARTAPPLLRPAVERLSARIGFTPLQHAVREFASEVDHPLADFVAAALITAAENQVREMGSLLGHLAQCCRDDVSMRTRVWVARARTRSAVRIIAVVVVVFVLGLILLDPDYLEPYGTPTGIAVAVLIAGMFAGSFAAMKRLGRIENPVRFIARREMVEP